jgi:hypothetical protein
MNLYCKKGEEKNKTIIFNGFTFSFQHCSCAATMHDSFNPQKWKNNKKTYFL